MLFPMQTATECEINLRAEKCENKLDWRGISEFKYFAILSAHVLCDLIKTA